MLYVLYTIFLVLVQLNMIKERFLDSFNRRIVEQPCILIDCVNLVYILSFSFYGVWLL